MNIEYIICDNCGKRVPNISTDYVKKNGHINKCKICAWKKRNQDKLIIDNYTIDEIDKFLYYFIYDNAKTLNGISKILERSIDDMILLFRHLKISNRKCLIDTTCEYCKKDFSMKLTPYCTSKYHYCSHECYYKDKTNKMESGKDSQFYNRIVTNCSNCGKEIERIPSKYNEKNKLGDNHNFCCNSCYYEFRSKYYVKEKSINYKKSFSKEWKEKLKLASGKRLKKMPSKNTTIQKAVNLILSNNNINYTNEYSIGFYSLDNYLLDYNLSIEVMGDYWHANPKIYNENGLKINKIQVKDIIRDKKKKTYIHNHLNSKILYLWESDIKNRPDVCEKLIMLFINNNGLIDNYNSFNYYLDKSNNIKINDSIIYPYYELNKSYYQKIIKAS